MTQRTHVSARQPDAGNDESVVDAVATSPWLAKLARVGLAARATIYVVLGVLALQLAFGVKRSEVDQFGVLRTIGRQSYGPPLLIALTIGFLGYAVWRACEAIYGEVGGKSDAKARVSSAARAIAYLVLAVLAILVLLNRDGGSKGDKKGSSATATILETGPGQFLVAVVGLAVAGVGVYMAVQGWRRQHERYLRMSEMTPQTRRFVCVLGRFGTIARGAVFALVGALTVRAAWEHDPSDAGGVDNAIKTLARTPGSWLLVVVAVGLVAFGVYSFAEARWRRTERPAT